MMLVVDVLDDISGMFQGELQFKALHGEHLLQSFGNCVQVGREVCGILGHPVVVYQVFCRHDGQLMIMNETHPEDGFVILFAALSVLLAHVEEVGAILAFLPKVARLLHAVLVVKERVLAVPLVDNAPPRGPSPNREHRGEEVIVGNALGYLVAVESGNHAYALIVLVAVEQFLAEWEERL